MPVQTLAYIIFCSLFLFCSCPWPYALNVQSSSCKGTDVFSVADQVFRNLFWKICPLFRQILITFLKCSRASFLLSSYGEKMNSGDFGDLGDFTLFSSAEIFWKLYLSTKWPHQVIRWNNGFLRRGWILDCILAEAIRKFVYKIFCLHFENFSLKKTVNGSTGFPL